MTTVFVISDLHLGGRPHPANGTGSRINSSYRHLTHFIDWLASGEAEDGPIELVINGDFVDFLLLDDPAHPPTPWTPDESEVIRRLDAIVAGTREGQARGPFDALADFCARADAQQLSLILLLGNHDLELCLPRVRQHLLQHVLRSDGRGVRFLYDNEAYCRGDLLIEHGNRYDILNAVNHDALRRERSAISRGENTTPTFQPDGRFIPPGGSVLVTELFNPLKQTYRFLDLLKPESEAVLPLMLVLEPKASALIDAIIKYGQVRLRAFAASRSEGEFTNLGYISSEGSTTPVNLSALLQRTLGEDALDFYVPLRGEIGYSDAWTVILAMKTRMAEWIQGLDETILASYNRKQLSAAMRALTADTSFKIDQECNTYLSEARRLVHSGQFSTVVFGHTHLPKHVSLPRGGMAPAQYLNTGTWADVIRVPSEVMGTGPDAEIAINAFLSDLAANRLTLTRYLSYARIRLHRGGDGCEKVVNADIRSYRGPSEPDAGPLTEPLSL